MSTEPSTSIAVVTGSSTGIGYATALRLARDGYHVVATMRRPSESDLESVARNEGHSLETATLDVTSDESVSDLFEDVLGRHGRVDVLVVNAGVGGSGGALETATLEEIRETMETNFFGALRCVKAVLASMRDRRSGTIVAMSSQAGRFAPPTMLAYSSSKWALEGAMESLAAAMVPFGVRVAIIEPGTILTPIFGKGDVGSPSPYQDAQDAVLRQIIFDLERGSDPSVVAECVAHAVTTTTPQLRYLVGQGAERNLRVRNSMTDQQYVELWLKPIDERMGVLLEGDL